MHSFSIKMGEDKGGYYYVSRATQGTGSSPDRSHNLSLGSDNAVGGEGEAKDFSSKDKSKFEREK